MDVCGLAGHRTESYGGHMLCTGNTGGRISLQSSAHNKDDAHHPDNRSAAFEVPATIVNIAYKGAIAIGGRDRILELRSDAPNLSPDNFTNNLSTKRNLWEHTRTDEEGEEIKGDYRCNHC